MTTAWPGFKPTRSLATLPFNEIIPNLHREAYGVDFETNSLGMRDREYTAAKPPGTFRIALLGSSHVMGFGLAAKDMFKTDARGPAQCRDFPPGRPVSELLNFAVNAGT